MHHLKKLPEIFIAIQLYNSNIMQGPKPEVDLLN